MADTLDSYEKALVPLRWAWEKFADFYMEGYDRRGLYKRLGIPSDTETVEETELRIRKREKLEASLKRELLSRICEEEYVVFGRDITQTISSALTRLPNSLFNDREKSFDIDWETSRITVFGKTITEIKIAPVDLSLSRTEKPKSGRKPDIPNLAPIARELAKERDDFPAPVLAESARMLEKYVRTNSDVLSNCKKFPSQRTFERAVKAAFPKTTK
ncbi:MAG: hypothetical protein Q9M45_02145 [Robiginitomaculum sp.]|nr:hypothetical protein [Robiginitomaculum sp.]